VKRRKGVGVEEQGVKGAWVEGTLLLFCVDVLDQPVCDALGPVEARVILVAEFGDVLFADDEALILHDEDWAAAAAGVGEEPQFTRLEQGGVGRDGGG
jgi:hypothetical protein